MNELLLRSVRIDWSAVSRESYTRRIKALQGLDELRFDAPVTCFAGENRTGKSTLLEAIAVACGFSAEGGTRNYRFSTCDTHSSLCEAVTTVYGARKPAWGYFLRAESFYNVATQESLYEGHERLIE